MKKLGSPRQKKKTPSKQSRLGHYVFSHTPESKQLTTNHSGKKFPTTMKPSLASTPRESPREHVVLSLKSLLKPEDTSERETRQTPRNPRDKKPFRTFTQQQQKATRPLKHKLPFASSTIGPESVSSKRKTINEHSKKKPRRSKKDTSPDRRKPPKLLKECKSLSAVKKLSKSKKSKKNKLNKKHSDPKSNLSPSIPRIHIPNTEEAAAIRIQALARGYLTRKAKKTHPILDMKSEESDRSIRDLSPIEFSSKMNSLELRRKLSDERQHLIATRKKQRQVENVLQEQLTWRKSQYEKLRELQDKDMSELQSIPGADSAVMNLFQGIIERRYCQLQALFDENIHTIQGALKESVDTNNEESLKKKVEKQSAVATQMIQDQRRGEEMVREVINRSKEEEFSVNFIEELKTLEFEKSVMEDSLCDHDEVNFEVLLNHIIDECILKSLAEADLVSIAIEKVLGSVLEDEIHCQQYDEASTPSSLCPVKTGTDAVVYYLETVLLEALHDNYELKYRLSCPVYHDTLEVLYQLQEGRRIEEGRAPPPIDNTAYLVIQKERNAKFTQEYPEETAEIVREADIIHNQMIFDAINESLASFRKYGEKGEPFPWSTNSRQFTSHIDLLYIMANTRKQIQEWNNLQTGKLPDVDMMHSDGEIDEEHLYNVREDKLANLLALEVIDFDHRWVDYEFEEDQVKISLEKQIFDNLIGELIQLIG